MFSRAKIRKFLPKKQCFFVGKVQIELLEAPIKLVIFLSSGEIFAKYKAKYIEKILEVNQVN